MPKTWRPNGIGRRRRGCSRLSRLSGWHRHVGPDRRARLAGRDETGRAPLGFGRARRSSRQRLTSSSTRSSTSCTSMPVVSTRIASGAAVSGACWPAGVALVPAFHVAQDLLEINRLTARLAFDEAPASALGQRGVQVDLEIRVGQTRRCRCPDRPSRPYRPRRCVRWARRMASRTPA